MVDLRCALSLLTAGVLFAGLVGVTAILSAGDKQFVCSGFAGAPLTVDGTTVITSSGLLELTNSMPQLKGHAVHPMPLWFQRTPGGPVRSFLASFVFGIIPEYADLSGHVI